MFECPNCKNKTLIWGSDFNAEDYGIEADGIISSLHCSNEECDVYVHTIELWDEELDITYKDMVVETYIEDDEENELESMIAWDNLYDRIEKNFFSKLSVDNI